MKAQNKKMMSVNIKMTLSLGQTSHRSWLRWLEVGLTLTAIAVHLAALLRH